MSTAEALNYQCFGAFFAALIFLIEGAATKETRDVQLQAAKMDYVNPEYLESSAFVRVYRKSRNSTPAFNALFPLIQDLPQEIQLRYLIFEKTHNAWRTTIIKGSVPVCSLLHSHIKVVKDIFDRSNFPKTCPVNKGNYTFTDVRVDGGSLPAEVPVPNGELKLKLSWAMPRVNFLIYALEMKIDKRGSTGGPVSQAATVAAINKTFG